jgi:hypothetical protein
MKLSLAPLVLFLSLTSAYADQRGEDLIRHYLKQSAQTPAVLTMQVDYQEPEKEPVQLDFTWMRKLRHGMMSHLIRIDSPPSEKGKLLLVQERGGGNADYIAYRPASSLKKKVRVTGARNYKYKGLTISVQELIGGELGKYHHQFSGDELVDGVPCYRVESLLQERFRDGSNYKRMLCHLRKDNGMLFKWELFGKSGELEKVVQAVEIKRVQDIWTVAQARVRDLKRKSELILTLKEARYNPELEDNLFSEEYLKQNSR